MKDKPTIEISPISNSYLTEVKEYKIIRRYKEFFIIMADNGRKAYFLYENCGHTLGLKWILK